MRKAYNQAQVARTKKLSKVIGDSNNILILYELTNFGEKSFNELKRMTDINAVTLSKKLNFLKTEGLVGCSQHGIENRYYLTEKSNEIKPLIKHIESLVIKK